MKRRQMPFALASVRPRGRRRRLRAATLPMPIPCFEMWRPAGRKENFSSRRETADAFGISLRWGRKRERLGDSERGGGGRRRERDEQPCCSFVALLRRHFVSPGIWSSGLAGRKKSKMLPRIESGKPLIRMRSIRKTCEQEWELALRTS